MMYWNWTTPVAQPIDNFIPGYTNQCHVVPGVFNNQQVDYQHMVMQLTNQEIPTIVIDDDDDNNEIGVESPVENQGLIWNQSGKVDNVEVNSHFLHGQIKTENLYKEIEDWTEVTVKEDPEIYEHDLKKESQREWIDLNELKFKKEISELTTVPVIPNEEPVLNHKKPEEKRVASEENTPVKNLKEEPPNTEEPHEEHIVGDVEPMKEPIETEEPHEEHMIVEDAEPARLNSSQELLKCDYCSYETEWRSSLSRHVVTRHKDITPELSDDEEDPPTKERGDEKFKCKHCQYKTNWKSNLNKHVISRHKPSEEIEWYECPHCSYKGKTKEYLRVHLNTTHEKFVQWHECLHCSFKAKMRYVLTNHVIVNHKAEEEIKWYKCSQCPYKAKLNGHLKKHVINQHTDVDNIKWFICDSCPYKAKTKKGLRLHRINLHTEHDKIQWFTCNKCGHKVKTKKNLVQHVKNCRGKGVPHARKIETKEVLVYMGNKLCFRRVPVDTCVNEKSLCKCKRCINPN